MFIQCLCDLKFGTQIPMNCSILNFKPLMSFVDYISISLGSKMYIKLFVGGFNRTNNMQFKLISISTFINFNFTVTVNNNIIPNMSCKNHEQQPGLWLMVMAMKSNSWHEGFEIFEPSLLDIDLFFGTWVPNFKSLKHWMKTTNLIPAKMRCRNVSDTVNHCIQYDQLCQ